MRFFYDTEFLEDGKTIDLISIGIVAEDGSDYYAVAKEITTGRLHRRLKRHEWLMANVVPSLPKPYGDWNNHMPTRWLFDYGSHYVKPRAQIAYEVAAFLLELGEPVELWADYGAYDHVALCQLFGPMMALPDGIPMWTNDLRQEVQRLCVDPDSLPVQAAGHHNALADARHLKVMYDHVAATRA